MPKSQPVIPLSSSTSPPPPLLPSTVHLETIYEESGSSFSSSSGDTHYQSRHCQPSLTFSTDQTIHGLISARSIPSVDAHRRGRQRLNEYQEKPPIEVRHRDGTKHYIHSSLIATATAMIANRRKCSHSSRHDLSSSTKINTKYRQIFNTLPKKKHSLLKKSEVILTIITAEDLSQAGVTPPSTSSPDESDTLGFVKSLSNSSLDSIQTVKDVSLNDIDEVSIEPLPKETIPPSIEPVVDIPILDLRSPVVSRRHSPPQQQLRHPRQTASTRSHSLPPPQSDGASSAHRKPILNQLPPVAVVPPSRKKSLPSLQITLTSDRNERNSQTQINGRKSIASSSKLTHEAMNSEHKHSPRSSNTISVGGGSRSAFRPFLKSTTFDSNSRIPSNINGRSQVSTNQWTQIFPKQYLIPSSHSHPQQQQPTTLPTKTSFTLHSSSKVNSVTHNGRSINADVSKRSGDSAIPTRAISNNRTVDHLQQGIPLSTIKPSSNRSNPSKASTKKSKLHSVTLDPHIQWHSVTSKSLYDVPRLSNQYCDIPLRITLPDSTPTHNQKLLYKHNSALEKRLLDAGLSPETIALYERILEVADNYQTDLTSPPEIIDQYQHSLLL